MKIVKNEPVRLELSEDPLTGEFDNTNACYDPKVARNRQTALVNTTSCESECYQYATIFKSEYLTVQS